MTTMNISLPDEMRTFVEQQVACGGYSSASEYVRALIRDAVKQEERRKLESMLLQGLESGAAAPLDDKKWQAIRQAVNKRLTGRESK
jgi:antitoxin ParD1/3/4